MKRFSMKFVDNSNRMYFGMCILAALVLTAVNVQFLASLQLQPVSSSSPMANALRFKLRQYEEVGKEAARRVQISWEPSGLRGGLPAPAPQTEPQADPSPEVAEVVEPATGGARLPELAGMVKTTDLQGQTRLMAVLNGGVVMERDRIGDFWVEKIAPEGVTLARGPQRWLIPAPEVNYSIDRAR